MRTDTFTKKTALVALLATAGSALPQALPQGAEVDFINGTSTIKASSYVGTTTANAFPATGTAVNSTLFPSEPVVGFPGPTPTGVEPAAAQTAPAYPYNNGPANQFPLVAPQPWGSGEFEQKFDISKYWGNLSPWYSVSSADYGLPDASPLIPEGCTINQMLLLYRHGARYPTTGAAPSTFAQKLINATATGNFSTSGELSFLSRWTYKLGAELLTPFGRSQNFNLGVAYRQLYGELLNNFTATGTIPVFRTESQDRMVKTAENFAAGFFGVPEFQQEVNIEIIVENPGVNNSGAPYEVCTNSNVASRGGIGSTAANAFAANAFNSTIARLQSQVTGVNFTSTDAIAMLQLCSYETVALGYSAFCNLFTEQDFLNYEYYYDLSFYYNNGPGSPVSAAQGKGYLQEWIAPLRAEKMLYDGKTEFDGGVPGFDTVLVFDADRTLAAEETGNTFWELVSQSANPSYEKNPMKTLFQTQGYSYHSFCQATLLYEEVADDEQFDALCVQVAAKVTIYPEMLTLLKLAMEQEHIRVLVMTCGLRLVWSKVLERENMSHKVKLPGGGRISDEIVITPDTRLL